MSQLMREILSHACSRPQYHKTGGACECLHPADRRRPGRRNTGAACAGFLPEPQTVPGDAGAAKLAQDTFFQHRPQKDSMVQAVDRDPADLGAALGETSTQPSSARRAIASRTVARLVPIWDARAFSLRNSPGRRVKSMMRCRSWL